MIEDLYRDWHRQVSGQRAWDYMNGVTSFHRIQVSPGLKAAVQWVAGQLRQQGWEPEIQEFKADGETMYWTNRLPQGWWVDEASLWLLDASGKPEQRLADFATEPISVIQRTGSTPAGQAVDLEVVVVENAAQASTYERVDVEGKAILSSENPTKVMQAASGQGAVCILYDGMMEVPGVRQAWDLPDARQYTAFRNVYKEVKMAGFVLTPRQGDQLRRAAQKGTVKVRAKVNARTFDSVSQNVSLLIEGQTEEEILVTAHLCHPRPSANDNASGAGCLLEVARTLAQRMQQPGWETPRRSIRLLWVPEMTGTYTYLATDPHAVERTLAGVNLDMVGGAQDKIGSVFQVEQPPRATANFVGSLMAAILRQATGLEALGNPSGTGGLSQLRTAVTPYSGGSDHMYMGDPMVGIPAPMLINWPDLYYHTSADVPENVDPCMQKRVAAMVGTYSEFLSRAGAEEASWLAQQAYLRQRQLLEQWYEQQLDKWKTSGAQGGDEQRTGNKWGREQERLSFLVERGQADLAAVLELEREQGGIAAEDSNVPALVKLVEQLQEALQQDADQLQQAVRGAQLDRGEDQAGDDGSHWAEARQLVYRRTYPGPVSLHPWRETLSEEQLKAFEEAEEAYRQRGGGDRFSTAVFTQLLEFWLDGSRSLAEAAKRASWESGHLDIEWALAYCRTLEQTGLLEQV